MFPSKSCRIQTCTSINLNSVVKTFSDYFSGAVKKLKSLIYPLKNSTWRYIKTLPRSTKNPFTFDYMSKRFVLKELEALKRQNAPSIDELPPGLLKECADIIVDPLGCIIDLSNKHLQYPQFGKSHR